MENALLIRFVISYLRLPLASDKQVPSWFGAFPPVEHLVAFQFFLLHQYFILFVKKFSNHSSTVDFFQRTLITIRYKFEFRKMFAILILIGIICFELLMEDYSSMHAVDNYLIYIAPRIPTSLASHKQVASSFARLLLLSTLHMQLLGSIFCCSNILLFIDIFKAFSYGEPTNVVLSLLCFMYIWQHGIWTTRLRIFSRRNKKRQEIMLR